MNHNFNLPSGPNSLAVVQPEVRRKRLRNMFIGLVAVVGVLAGADVAANKIAQQEIISHQVQDIEQQLDNQFSVLTATELKVVPHGEDTSKYQVEVSAAADNNRPFIFSLDKIIDLTNNSSSWGLQPDIEAVSTVDFSSGSFNLGQKSSSCTLNFGNNYVITTASQLKSFVAEYNNPQALASVSCNPSTVQIKKSN